MLLCLYSINHLLCDPWNELIWLAALSSTDITLPWLIAENLRLCTHALYTLCKMCDSWALGTEQVVWFVYESGVQWMLLELVKFWMKLCRRVDSGNKQPYCPWNCHETWKLLGSDWIRWCFWDKMSFSVRIEILSSLSFANLLMR